MSLGLVGYKLGMTRIFLQNGEPVPVTVLRLGPCPVVEIKREEKDGYRAVKVAFEPVQEKKIKKPLLGIFRKKGLSPHRYLCEFRLKEGEEFPEEGSVLSVSLFSEGVRVHITGRSKGRGFSGVMKRHGFHGGPDAHGSKFHRVPGSSGTNTTPGRVWKGKRFPGHYGDERVTIRNLTVVRVIPEENLLLVRGAVPGARNSFVKVVKAS